MKKDTYPLPVQSRVYHYGQQYPGAARGTGTVLEYRVSRDGTCEYLVQRDTRILPGTPNESTWWSSRVTYPAVLPGEGSVTCGV